MNFEKFSPLKFKKKEEISQSQEYIKKREFGF